MGHNVLVTGGAGYVGSLLCRELLADPSVEVTIYDNFTYGVEPILPILGARKLRVVEADVRHEDRLREAVAEADVVIHLAAVVGYPACNANPENAISINRDATRSLAGLLAPDQLLVYGSTGSVYGKVEDLASENTPINPLTLYALTKYEGEVAVMERENSVSLRFMTLFGVSPRLRMDLLVNDLVFQAYRNKALALFEMGARRGFLHCKDAAESYRFTIDHFGDMKGGIFNVGHPDLNLTKRDVAMTIAKFIDFHLLEEEGRADPDGRDYEVDFSRLLALGYRPRISLEEGIEELLKLYSISSFYRHFRNA
jgi:nucleoside-diphosphate-sugar epimerase